jgi:DNA topoisomerase-1
MPTDVGRIVNKFLTAYFTRYVDYNFTANLEDELDAVSRGEMEWIPLLEKFWKPFKEQIDHTQEHVKRSDVTQEKMDEACPECGKPLAIRLGRHGRFIGCTDYPTCSYARNLGDDAHAQAPTETVEGRTCPQCESTLIIKQGRYGKFIGCSSYPKCKFIEPLEKPTDTGVNCPQCKKGTLLLRKSRRGKVFYSCSTYPKCDYATWNEPLNEQCPSCGWPILTLKTTKRSGTQKVCPQKECDFIENVESEES